MLEKNSIHIRLIKPHEAEFLPAIEQSAGERFRNLPALAWLADGENMSAQEHLRYIASGTSWVADVNGVLVGFLCAEVADTALHIREFDVRLNWQGKGIGRQLMQTVIAYAISNRFESLTLTTFRDVAWNEPFYQSFGFETLTLENMDTRLGQLLRDEVEHGFPAALRCAMRRILSPAEKGA